jgi:hypothetical protein
MMMMMVMMLLIIIIIIIIIIIKLTANGLLPGGSGYNACTKLKLNSVALVRERTIPTERPPPVGEVSANVCG